MSINKVKIVHPVYGESTVVHESLRVWEARGWSQVEATTKVEPEIASTVAKPFTIKSVKPKRSEENNGPSDSE